MGSQPSKIGSEERRVAIRKHRLLAKAEKAVSSSKVVQVAEESRSDQSVNYRRQTLTPHSLETPRTTHMNMNGVSMAPRQGMSSHIPTGGIPEKRDQYDGNSSLVNDDEVKVNLAMADLMAYLQVVANNSNNLPLTRRDDPEVGKTVSSLTSDEYARKSAAFVPADVRIIAGSFTKYGRVWDLPTSEEYNASDGAQEPGTKMIARPSEKIGEHPFA